MDHHKWETWTDQRSMQCKLDHKPRPLPVAMRVHYSTDVLAGKGGGTVPHVHCVRDKVCQNGE